MGEIPELIQREDVWKPAQGRFLTVSGMGATIASFLLAQIHTAEEQETAIH